MDRKAKGQALPLFAIFLILLLAFAGLAIDAGQLYVARHNAQSAADASALAGALALFRGQNVQTAGLNAAALNGFNNNFVTNTVVVNNPPVSGPYTGNAKYVQVIITNKVYTNLIQLVYSGITQNTSEAVAKGDTASVVNAIWAAGTTCPGISFGGNATLTLVNANMYSNPACAGSITSNGGVNILIPQGGGLINEVGTTVVKGSGSINPTPITGVTPLAVPAVPAPNCGAAANFGVTSLPTYTTFNASVTTVPTGIYNVALKLNAGVSYTFYPGVYNQAVTLNGGTINFTPGLYCFNSSFTNGSSNSSTVNGSNNILIYIGANGSFDLSGGSTINLSASTTSTVFQDVSTPAPHTTDYQGMLIYASSPYPPGTPNALTFGGNSSTNYTGTIYAPNSTCTMKGSTVIDSYNSQIICLNFSTSGNVTASITWDPSKNFNLPGQKSISLVQ